MNLARNERDSLVLLVPLVPQTYSTLYATNAMARSTPLVSLFPLLSPVPPFPLVLQT